MHCFNSSKTPKIQGNSISHDFQKIAYQASKIPLLHSNHIEKLLFHIGMVRHRVGSQVVFMHQGKTWKLGP